MSDAMSKTLAIADADERARDAGLPTYSELADVLQAMWAFASVLVEKHGVDGDNTMTNDEHAAWQDAAGAANNTLNRIQA